MDDSMAHPPAGFGRSERSAEAPWAVDLPVWKTTAATIAAVLLAGLFLIAGVWKITDPYGAAARMVQAKVPGSLGLAAAIGFGIAETFSAVLLLVPRFRRWGAWITGLMLVAFMVYVGYYYEALRGEDCSCFPWLKRAVGPGFFISDAAMLALAVLAGWWAKPSKGLRAAGTILGAVAVFAFVSYGVIAARLTGTKAPDTITIAGKTESLQTGKVFLYFFDPECSHCYQAAKQMGTFQWKEVRLVAVPTAQPQFAQGFLDETKFKAALSNDLEPLRKVFPFAAGPFGVLLENGRQQAAIISFDDKEPSASLRQYGFIE